jgi:hypothetical protein
MFTSNSTVAIHCRVLRDRVPRNLSRRRLPAASVVLCALMAVVVQPPAVSGRAEQASSNSSDGNRWMAGAMYVRDSGSSEILDGTGPITTGGEEWGGIAGNCNSNLIGYSTHDFIDDAFVAQGGLVETEIAAVTFTVPAIEFPVRIDLVEAIFGTQNPQVQITTHWSLLVWSGQPNNGTLVGSIVSDGKNPPHMILSPPTNAIHLQAGVDPGDPDQIVVPNNGSNKFSVGFRIDQHNQPATVSCACIPGFPGFGTYPAICCPAPACCNIFPTTDTNGLAQPGNNWIFARNCPGATGACDPNGGWITSGTAGLSGDWIIRVTYSPSGCTPIVGACCLQNGTCLEAVTPSQCASATGVYQGDNTLCTSVNCPQPGACCLQNGSCVEGVTQPACSAQGGVFQGAGTECANVNCPQPVGTCCVNGTCTHLTEAQCLAQGGEFISSTPIFCTANTCKGACCIQSSQSCQFIIESLCTAAGGEFQGVGIQCNQIVCFPIGACCLPDGGCVDTQTPESCEAQNGTFQGNATTCSGVSCPTPKGVCCVNNVCVDNVSQSDCTSVAGTWLGPGESCSTPNVCTQPPCPADVTGNGVVNIDDLLGVINGWGNCTPPCSAGSGCPADVTDNCVVNIDDLLGVINEWGPC